MLKNKILKLSKIKETNSIAGDGSWINFKAYANNTKIKTLWMKSYNLEIIKEMLDSKKLEFKEIINNDYKLIYKCIVLNKILFQGKDKTDS